MVEQKIKKYFPEKWGNAQVLKDGKFNKVGTMSVGVDSKGREKFICNIGENVYSGFLNPVLTEEQREKLRDFRDQLLKS